MAVNIILFLASRKMPKNTAELCENLSGNLFAGSGAPVSIAKKNNKNAGLALILLATIFSSISPLPAAIFGVGGNLIFILGCVIFLVYFFCTGGRYPVRKLSVVMVPILVALPSAIYWRELSLLFFPIYLTASILIVMVVSEGVVREFSEIATKFLVVVAAGAWIGFFYALLGGGSLFSIENPDGRTNDFFLATFSNWYIGNLIRPAGVFDEPGTLSFVICFVSALRGRLSQSRKITWLLLFLGLITTSLAHVIYMIFHGIADRKSFIGNKAIIVVVPCAMMVGGFLFAGWVGDADSKESEIFLSRFLIEDGKIGGDTRSEMFFSALGKINSENFLFGVDGDCISRPTVCEAKGHEFGETPAGMILLLGIFLAAPYFLVLILTASLLFSRSGFLFFGIFLILLQRPYVSLFGYSLLILVVVFSKISKKSITMA